MKSQNNNSVQDQDGNSSKPLLPVVFSFNEKVIWDSFFGYEIGYFLGEGNHFHTYMIDMITGLIHEPSSYPKQEIYKYTNGLIEKLTVKYGYEKRFSEVF